VLQQQVQELSQSKTPDERWSKWLEPTVDVLYALSATLRECVGLVCLISASRGVRSYGWLLGVLTRESDLCGSRRPPFGANPPSPRFIVTLTYPRRPRMFAQVMTVSSTFLNVLRILSDDSKCTPRCHRPRK
jgi:hypothetical protein